MSLETTKTIDATQDNPVKFPVPSAGLSFAPSSNFYVKPLSSKGICPTRANTTDAGWDLYSSVNTFVPMRGKMIVKTDISVTVPIGTYGRIAPRSGLAAKHSIDVGAGVIDRGYTGEICVVLFNHSDVDFQIVEGDRIAQLVLEKIDDYSTPLVVEELPTSTRGTGGFGSTGK